MLEKSGRDQGSHFTAFRERAEIPDEHAEGITVERRGNPEVLNVVCDDPAVVLGGGEVLFKEGDAADGMYIVKSGTLRIRSGSVVYEDAVAGGVVGEMAIVEDELPRSAMVYALGRSEVVKISEKRFFDLGAQKPAFARTVMRVLSRQLRRMDRLYQPERRMGHILGS